MTGPVAARTAGGGALAPLAVVVPCYNVAGTVAGVLSEIGPEVQRIYCVDDASSDGTGEVLERAAARDPRVRVLRRPSNGGVGAAVVDGYRAAIADGAGIIVKLDGDGQMNPRFAGQFARPIRDGDADYVKGNRFFHLGTVRRMPRARLLGNIGLSFLSKLSTGYWDLFDPTNGYTAIEASMAELLPLEQVSRRYFFESDLLHRLSLLRARVVELPLETVYGDEASGLSPLRCLVTFPFLHLRNLGRRILYNYYLRNFSVASVNLLLGLLLLGFGVGFGAWKWIEVLASGQAATAGTVMLSALPAIVGTQLLLNFLSYDMSMVPREAVHTRLIQLRLLESGAPRRPEAASAGR